jgi:diguanylate cyclase (GGDEF)-like protein/PAS domain S-box-containing protein
MAHDSTQELPADLQRMLFEHASDAMFVLSEQGKIITVNQTACDYLGYSKEELLNTPPQNIVAPEYAASFPERIARIKAEGHCTFEMVHVHRNGRRIPVEMHSRLVSHFGCSVILTICRDITARKNVELEYRSIIQAAGDGYWAVRAADARIVDVNDMFCRMVGYSRDELLSMTISDLEALESPEETAAHIRKIMADGHDLFETRQRCKDGRLLDLEISVSYAETAGGMFFIFARDISVRKQQEAEAKLAALIFNASTASIMATDADNRIVTVNPAFTRTTGYELHEVIGKNPKLLQSGRQDQAFYRAMWQALAQSGHWEGEWWNRRKSGAEYAEQVAMNVVRHHDGSVYRYVKISSDITEKKRLDDQIWRQAHYDTVTGLPNRRLFHTQLAAEIRRCRERRQLLALYFIDLDGFKKVNDTYGHDAGDRLLVQAAQRIARSIRGTDTVARLGGDEFTVMLSGLSDVSRIEPLGRQILDLLAHPFLLDDAEVCISASIGIALYPNDAADVDELMKQADQAMYAAKNGGKNTLRYFNRPDSLRK